MPYKFTPITGMKTTEPYLHGIGSTLSNWFETEAVIDHVGTDYFVLRETGRNELLLVTERNYYLIEKTDFTNG